jgi:hypothetical protein
VIYLVTYDPVTKRLARRVRLGDPTHKVNYPNSVEITREQWENEPERNLMIDEKSMTVRAIYLYDGLKLEDLP